MRDLRQRLMAIAKNSEAKRPESPPEVKAGETFFCREGIVPRAMLGDIDSVTLNDVCTCDPYFSGKSWHTERLLFLDTETTGLSGGAGTVAFEIGAGWIEPRGMVIRQYVMRDYGQEADMLREVASLIAHADTIVTFNGKSFDLPLLESRMIMNRIRVHVTDMPHLDLLHAARRVYKLRLGRCNLTALEEAVLGKTRCDDLPGAQVPERYFTYLKTGEFALLEDVLRHNFDDIQSLAELTAVICSAYRQPELLRYEQDILSVGKTLLHGRRTQQARNCLKILGHSTLAPQSHLYLASSYKQGREWTEAAELWKTMIAKGEGGAWPYIELAKYYEHVQHDYDIALRYATSALQYLLNTMPLNGDDEKQIAPLFKRIERLKRKQRTYQGGIIP